MNKKKMNTQPYPLETRLCEFEKNWTINSFANVIDFLPDERNSNFINALTEFVRVDMELRFDAGNPCFAEEYLSQYPRLREFADTRSLLVFEEFRLRNIAGDYISANAIASHYDVSMANWPNVDLENGASSLGQSTEIARMQFDRKRLPKIGENFANFRIIGKLGEGAFGTVMLAQQDDLAGRLTVLKFVPPFSQEHRFLARLQHSNIVPVYSVHGNERFMAICMPFMGVATLQDLNGNISKSADSVTRLSVESHSLIQTTTRLKEKTVADTITDQDDLALFQERNKLESTSRSAHQIWAFRRFAAETVLSIAEGLAYAHEHGIVHGDLKPANILINDDYEPVLLDFHLASSQTEKVGSHIGGTLAYMAPEHFDALNSGEQVDAPTDIYSAGVILFELVTGRLPFTGKNAHSTLEAMKALRQKQPKLSVDDRSLLGHDLSSIVLKCLTPEPVERYKDGTELAEDLRAHLENRRLVYASDSYLGNRLSKWARRNPSLSSASSIASLAVLIVAAILVGLFAVNRQVSILEASNESLQVNSEFEKLRQPLASWVYSDRSHFENAIEEAKSALKTFGWESIQQQNELERFELLDETQQLAERNRAAEMHFWLAEGLQRLALERAFDATQEEQHQLLKNALEHNQSAIDFWSGDEPLQGLVLQREKISTRMTNPAYEPKVDLESVSSNSLDKTITAFQLRFKNLESRKLWNEVIEEEPTQNALPWLCLGQNYYRSGDFDTAKACFTVCIGLEPKNGYAKIFRAMSLLELNEDLETAKSDLLQAKKLEGDDVVILQNLALVHGKLRDFETAKSFYDKAIDLGTTNTRVWYLRSLLNRRLGNEAAATADLKYFLENQPTDSQSYRTRGTFRIASDPIGAIDDLREAVKGNSKDWKALNNIAHLQSEKLNDLESAIATMDKVVQLQPGSAKNLATRGVLKARLGKRKEALEDARSSLKLDSSADTMYRVAGIYAQTSKLQKKDQKMAFRCLKTAVASNPQLVMRMMQSDPDIKPLKNEKPMEEICKSSGKLSSFPEINIRIRIGWRICNVYRVYRVWPKDQTNCRFS